MLKPSHLQTDPSRRIYSLANPTTPPNPEKAPSTEGAFSVGMLLAAWSNTACASRKEAAVREDLCDGDGFFFPEPEWIVPATVDGARLLNALLATSPAAAVAGSEDRRLPAGVRRPDT